jgi:hypothetical protein
MFVQHCLFSMGARTPSVRAEHATPLRSIGYEGRSRFFARGVAGHQNSA